jgi:hypothetical protein
VTYIIYMRGGGVGGGQGVERALESEDLRKADWHKSFGDWKDKAGGVERKYGMDEHLIDMTTNWGQRVDSIDPHLLSFVPCPWINRALCDVDHLA